ncbi:calcium-independent phospholipase [Fusarium phyllophilum]|uniref:Calcium-independent phospholipase n=1 Tax=Fusarium phyllophilum TaxID=47803 RepID=A0A8H5JK85_9HYPO|nr:calcium-independent phospholipase [Fusarium phyllophilum]
MSTSGGISLDHFHARLTVLQKQHQPLKAADLEMRATQSERCRSSLEKAVKSLFQVITLVRKHDKRLVAWHDRSPHLKSALRLIGIDRRTEHTVSKTTAKLKNGVHKVETQFEYAGQVIGESIDDTTRFQKDFSQISHSGVEENLQAMRAAEAELKKELEDLKYQIQNQDVECSGAMAELMLQIQRVEKLTADHDSARAWKNTWGAVTVLAAAGACAMTVVGISVGIVAGVKTLRGMAARLDGILKNILQFPAKAKLKAIGQKLIEQATGGIRAISDATAEVMAIVAHPPDINGLIHDITRDRRQENRSKSPIIFLGHSFGGTVLKQVYVATHPSNTDDPEYKALHSHIRGYVFFGTIHKDRDMSRAKLEVPEFWRALSRGASGTLGGHSHELEKAMYTTFRVNHAFRRLGGENLLINCFYETKGPGGLSRRVLITQEESTLVSRPVPTMPLDLDHQSLVCFKGPRDENLARVLDALDSFMIRAMDVETRLHRPIASESRGLCLLSLDGGGVKGLFSIIVINRLMQETRRLEGPGAELKKPCDYFDLIGGTSTGGLLAIMLGRLQMDTQLCIQAYKSLSKEVFSRKFKVPFLENFRKASNVALSWPWFDGDKLKEAVCRTVKENLLPSDSAMLRQSGCTVEDLTLITDMKSATYSFVCAVPKYEEKVKRIRSYEPLDQQKNAPAERFKIWEAARATSAAPMYFPHIEAGGVSYFDGGLESNNPVIEVIEEAKQEFPDDKISTVISVGTGAYQASDASAGLAGFMNYMINMATSTEAS